jgi:phage-related protein
VASFPLLSSGAVSQYPTEIYTGRGVTAIRFLDGSDQRFLRTTRRLRRWKIEFSFLTDEEISALEGFFRDQKGSFSPFTFRDPVSNTEVQNCRLATSEISAEYLGINSISSSFWIMETNG